MSEQQGRIELVTLERSVQLTEQLGIPAILADRNIFRLLLRRPTLAKAVNELLYSLLYGAALDDRLRELVIMRIAWVSGSDYEWTQHYGVAVRAFGCTEEDLAAVRDWQNASHFGAREKAVLAATDETLAVGKISEPTWRQCRQEVGSEEACLDLVASIGAWTMISQIARSTELPLETGASSWAPDGVAP
ncbi:MAG: carboxymuconolactone decarboxylase family protein [Gammaproteobacteria bacterium]|jgi:alkylhydroperoxidase family enzyme|nr:carboxymuconolactone decarboxylase family protein [Gammaproteobacteria bacterium]MBP6051187.1 carboxymuconolactone decarboxylase family protein [Pseudomonadales bacterium]MBK6581533.1 carboxymuconolactone decarboxylase family protein [Gammaproteobacteria bacterium]MBK7170389.1 carboxymuconolactone decarboxylase family protein [Gammaproteobacteria bacterium]MBK7522294.1 carboxymuconolactone decarboxylase family protein [Gammaproteobacteria bacterium]